MTLFAIVLFALGAGILLWQARAHPTHQSSTLPPFRFLLLPVVGLVLQAIALRWAGGIERTILFVLSQCLLVVFFVANRSTPALWLLAVGFLLNLLPMIFNGGYMPITPEAMSKLNPAVAVEHWQSGLVRPGSKDIVLPASDAPFWFLGDVFVLSRPFPLPTAFSIGDLVLLVGFGVALYQFSKPKGVVHGESSRSGATG
ncbi:MAG: DUF5317 domain-containing protein [Chloroflexi bacterium]|nr:DUF5317 domain-containing protein [Chloroflexota bacterium]